MRQSVLSHHQLNICNRKEWSVSFNQHEDTHLVEVIKCHNPRDRWEVEKEWDQKREEAAGFTKEGEIV